MTRFAFELSEKCELPVILRPTTRLCHARQRVRFGACTPVRVTGFERIPQRFVPVPANARRLRLEIPRRMETARTMMAASPFYSVERRSRRAILASGVPSAVCRDVLADLGIAHELTVLQLGCIHPLPTDWLVENLATLDTVLVVEELSPFLEDILRSLCSLHGLGVRILGKRTHHFPEEGEYEPALVQHAIHAAFDLGARVEPTPRFEVPIARPPILCAGCSHRSAFFAARAAFGDDMLYMNDIGCYTLGYGEPLDTADALLSMGAGFTLAAGVARMTKRRTVGFMGDSTFFHSGMPALLDAIKEDANIVAVILDNNVTAMTGFQESPGSTVQAGAITPKADIEAVVRALGARHVDAVDPNDLPATIAAFRRAKEATGVAVVITRRPCVVFEHKLARDRLAAPATTAEPSAT